MSAERVVSGRRAVTAILTSVPACVLVGVLAKRLQLPPDDVGALMFSVLAGTLPAVAASDGQPWWRVLIGALMLSSGFAGTLVVANRLLAS